MRVHLPEPHFDAVSEEHNELLLEPCFTSLLRRKQQVETRSIRAVVRVDHSRKRDRFEVCPCLGSGCLLRRALVVRTRAAFLHSLRDYHSGSSCVNAWDTM